MRLGFVGVGKLGFPMALAFDQAGHDCYVTDTSDLIFRHVESRTWPHREKGVPELLKTHRLKWVEMGELDCDVVFVAVQTPHPSRLDGTVPLTVKPQDFDYTYLTRSLSQVAAPTVAVVSTVLPGTWQRLYTAVDNYVYNPSFIAMGTVVDDLRRAEFNLIGSDDTDTSKLAEVWRTLNDAPTVEMKITEAEAVKMAYNSYISAKIAIANTWGWLGQEVGFDAGVVMETLALADRRLLSRSYLAPGIGDGGACHPRDLLALSYLANKHNVYNVFSTLVRQRETHMQWLAGRLPNGIVIFGRAFKAESEIDTGSASLLLAHYLDRQGKTFTIGDDPTPGPANFIATPHARYRKIVWPEGSTVIDPHGIIKDQAGVTVIHPGR